MQIVLKWMGLCRATPGAGANEGPAIGSPGRNAEAAAGGSAEGPSGVAGDGLWNKGSTVVRVRIAFAVPKQGLLGYDIT